MDKYKSDNLKSFTPQIIVVILYTCTINNILNFYIPNLWKMFDTRSFKIKLSSMCNVVYMNVTNLIELLGREQPIIISPEIRNMSCIYIKYI